MWQTIVLITNQFSLNKSNNFIFSSQLKSSKYHFKFIFHIVWNIGTDFWSMIFDQKSFIFRLIFVKIHDFFTNFCPIFDLKSIIFRLIFVKNASFDRRNTEDEVRAKQKQGWYGVQRHIYSHCSLFCWREWLWCYTIGEIMLFA